MQDKTLLKISIFTSIVGIVALYFIMQPSEIRIGDINRDYTGRTVKVLGEISSKYESKNGHIFLKLADSSGEISVVIFNNTKVERNLEIGQMIEISGEIEEYKGELEIILKTIAIL